MDLEPFQEVHSFIEKRCLVDAGKCYQVAFLAAQLLQKQGVELQIVHGNPRHCAERRARRIGHAWNGLVDESYAVPHELVFDFSRPTLIVLPRDFYYGTGAITVARAYSFQEGQQLFDEKEGYGPWDHCFSQLLYNYEPREKAS